MRLWPLLVGLASSSDSLAPDNRLRRGGDVKLDRDYALETRQALLSQLGPSDESEKAYAPDLEETNLEVKILEGPGSEVTFTMKEKPIAITSSSVVFEATKDGESEYKYIVKYQHNCGDGYGVHPLARDFIYTHIAAKFGGITKQPLYVSPPVELPEASGKTKKVEFDGWTDDTYARCKGATIRLSVQERGGDSMKSFREKSPVTLVQAMKFGRQLIGLLVKLHSIGISHGDIHPGNVVFSEMTGRDLGEDPIALIDFGMAKYYVEEMGEYRKKNEIGNRALVLLSPWELNKRRATRRDDVYRAIELVAFLLRGKEFSDALETIQEDEVSIKYLKQNGRLFDPELIVGKNSKKLSDPYSSLKDSQRKEISNMLQAMLSRVLSLQYTEEPDYAGIMNAFAFVEQVGR